jgi:hypothetical protein
MFSNSTSTPMTYRSNAMFAPTFNAPVTKDRSAQDSQRNQSMAQAAYAGNQRQFQQQPRGQGVQAGSKMQAYRSGMMADAEAGKAYAQSQQDMLNRQADNKSAMLQYMERLSGQRGWIRDLNLDQDSVKSQSMLSGYKRYTDIYLNDLSRAVKETVADHARDTTILQSLI